MNIIEAFIRICVAIDMPFEIKPDPGGSGHYEITLGEFKFSGLYGVKHEDAFLDILGHLLRPYKKK